MKGAKSPAPTARLRRAASPSGEVVFYTGAASFFRKKTPARLENTCSICYHWYTCQRAEPPFPLLWHWKRFNPFPFKHTRASPPPSGKPHPPGARRRSPYRRIRKSPDESVCTPKSVCRGRCLHRPTQLAPILRKSPANAQLPHFTLLLHISVLLQ